MYLRLSHLWVWHFSMQSGFIIGNLINTLQPWHMAMNIILVIHDIMIRQVWCILAATYGSNQEVRDVYGHLHAQSGHPHKYIACILYRFCWGMSCINFCILAIQEFKKMGPFICFGSPTACFAVSNLLWSEPDHNVRTGEFRELKNCMALQL